ncbi:MAG: hypothetical protein ACXW08_13755 [Solirubrobacteraceae bacterium]
MINADWHNAHRMPKNPTFEQRLEWHRAHARECGCRKPPADLEAWIARGTPKHAGAGRDGRQDRK